MQLNVQLRNIVLTNHYERPFKPGFGGSIRDLLFELTTARKITKSTKLGIKEYDTNF